MRPPDERAPAPVLERLREAFARAPDGIALRAPDVGGGGARALTFAELDARTAALAASLAERGAGPEARVAIALERSPELVVAVLGTLRAGAAYVPLDPGDPRERLAWVAQDARPAAVVTTRALAPAFGAGGARVLCREDLPADGAPPDLALDPSNAAYVLYTSGTTGRPKGVVVPCGAVANHMAWMARAFDLGSDERFLLKTPTGFDASVWELLLPPMLGAELVVAPPLAHRDPAELCEVVRAGRVTVLQVVPTLLRALVALPAFERCTDLRLLFSGGERLPGELVREVHARSRVTVVNLYGPTEACIDASAWVCDDGEGEPPIGRPIDGVRFHVLSEGLEPLPRGAVGQLAIGGAGLARGYHGRPALSAERFVPDPFAGTNGTAPGARLYLTGDLVHEDEQGAFHYHGRADDQVKLRGQRLELGEVEALLRADPRVRDAAAVVRELAPGDERLFAFVVPADAAAPSGEGGHGGDDPLGAEHVERWRAVLDEVYAGEGAGEADFDTVGWNSSVTGEPIPAEEMAEWVGATVARILALRPRRVLELGCGTGLLLFRVAPRCERYVATDLSAAGLARVAREVERRGLTGVELERRAADDLEGLAGFDGPFDTIVLNSVAQFFPSAAYLERVVAAALERLAPGGHLFVGDLRSLPLLATFHASVQRHHAAGAPEAELARRVRRRVEEEEDLVVHPDFFRALVRRLPRLAAADVLVKRGRHGNELSRFRYDVVLTADEAPPADPVPELAWGREVADLEDLRARVVAAAGPLRVRGVPNARLVLEVTEARALLEEQSEGEPAADAVDPEALYALGEALGVEARVDWSADGRLERVDAWFAPRRSDGAFVPAAPVERDALPEPGALANRPTAREHARALVAELRERLRRALPEGLVPAAVVPLDALPVLPSGKLDRAALPTPEVGRGALAGELVEPRTPLERTLAEVWADVLGLERVGVADDFLDLGGHSLLATRIVARVAQGLGVELPVRSLFETRTVAGLAAAVDARRRAGADGGARADAIPRLASDSAPLSPAQERLWFLDRWEPGVATYNVPSAWRLVGPFDEDALGRALAALAARHEVLRTVIESPGGEPRARVLPELAPRFERADLRGGTIEVTAWLEERSRAPFDLERGPVLRACVARTGDEERVLLLVLHHVACDGWGLRVLLRDLGELYAAQREARAPVLPPLPVQVGDVAAWQRARLAGPELERQLASWRARFADLPSPLELPADRPRPPVRGTRGALAVQRLPARLSTELADLARALGATPFMVLLAATQALLARLSGQEDVVVGTPVAGRGRPELEELVGCFINTLALRGDLSGDPSFAELVARAREVSLAAQAHQELPFEKLVEALDPPRDLARTPLFQAMLVLQNEPHATWTLPDCRVEPRTVDLGTARFDLTLLAELRGGELEIVWEYATDLFERASVERLQGYLRTLLEGALADPETPLSRLPLVGAEERARVLEAWNATAVAWPDDPCLHELVLRQAAATPDAPALVAGDEALAYAELAARVGRLANHLRALGVGPEVRVGLCLERSADLVVALLAIQAAGGAYVPVATDHPPERIAFVMADVDAALVVTAERWLARMPAGLATVCVDRDAAAIAARPATPPSAAETGVRAGNLGYVIFTSGSTGRPKGVALAHRGAVNLVRWAQGVYAPAERARVLAGTSVCFDLSVFELFVPLASGGTVLLAEDLLALRDAPALAPTLLNTVPSAIAELLRAGALPASVHTVNLAGEPLPRELVDALHGVGVQRVVNLYAPSETTTYSTFVEVPRGVPDAPTIGRPLANTRAYVLDPTGEPTPLGVPGELCLGGAGVARGYLGRPALTAERFRPDAFAGEGARVYATGDHARWRAEGELEFLGRRDHQVKLRGFRIELGEIEARLTEHPAVREAAAVVRPGPGGAEGTEGAPGELRLVAYVTADESLSSLVLRRHLKRSLPPYMIPNSFVQLEAFPRTTSGKLDRTALPAPEARAAGEGSFVAPETDLERELARAFADVLGLERVGRHDNFLDLGGHSLLAVRAVDRFAERTGVRLRLKDLFLGTVAQLAGGAGGNGGGA